MSDRIPVGVIGCGRMGRLHARVLSSMPRFQLVGVHDLDADAASQAAADYQTKSFKTVAELLSNVRAVTIASPTVAHEPLAKQAVDAGVAVLVEKPLAPDSAAARRIVEHAASKSVPLMVGHIERFNPAVRALRSMNVTPQFIEVTRISPLSFRSIDVGVVLDLMIHDIDIVLQLARSTVESVDAVGVGVVGGGDGSAEDIANARIRFANGCVANLTASRLAMKVERKLRVFSPEAYVSLDYHKRTGLVVRRGENLAELRELVAKIRTGEIDDVSQVNYAELVDMEELTIDDVEPLTAEFESFARTVEGKASPEVSGKDGLLAVELAERVVAAIAKRRI